MNILEINTLQLSSSPHLFKGMASIKRVEASEIAAWIRMMIPQKTAKKVCLLTGTAGQGKTVVLCQLLDEMAKYEHFHVFAIKADMLDYSVLDPTTFISTYADEFKKLSDLDEYPVLIIDQIDALSKTLSADRKPINLLDSLISAISIIPNARIIVSCRPYDMDFDPVLSKYKHEKNIGLKSLEVGQVNEVLGQLDMKTYQEGTKMSDFLRVPINLELFLEYGKEDCEVVSLQSLMDELWTSKITRIDNHVPVESERVLNCLSEIVALLSHSSSLAINKKKLERYYSAEVDYLVSEGILVETGNKDYVSFAHQSLADYVSARILFESGKAMVDILNKEHQGLYVRNKVKQYFSYIREASSEDYLKELREVVTDEGGKYRTHIKMLILTTLASFEEPMEEEKDFVSRYVMCKPLYRNMFIEAIYKKEWFNYVSSHPIITKALHDKDEEVVTLMKETCLNVMPYEWEPVRNFLKQQVVPGDLQWNQQWMDVVNRYPREEILKDMEYLYEMSVGDEPFRYNNYLENLAKVDYDFVENKLLCDVTEAIRKQMAEKDEKGFYLRVIYLNQHTYHLLEELFDKYKERAAFTYIELIKRIDDGSRIDEVELYKHLESWAYHTYSGSSYYSHHEQLVADFSEYASELVVKGDETMIRMVKELLKDERSILYYMGLELSRTNVALFENEIMSILTNTSKLEELDSKIFYQIAELLKAVFPILNDEKKAKIVETIAAVSPEWEKMAMPDLRKYQVPLYHIGRRKQELLSVLPEEYLRKNSLENWHYLQRLNRELKKADIHEPYRVYSKGGWNAHSLDKMRSMKTPNLLKAFKKYQTNNVGFNDMPTRQGECMNFQTLVTENPQRYVEVIEKVLDDKEIDREYAAYGIIGLMKADYDITVIKQLTDRLIGDLSEDIQNPDYLYSIMHVLREMDYFSKRDEVTKVMLDFMCKVLMEYKEEKRKDEDLEHHADVYNTGINRVRGCAAFHLVQCDGMKEYKDQIFEALESCVDATPDTKGAIILQQALLNNLDIQRNFNLYMSLMKDLTPSLAMIPLNNLHPLVYFINTNFDDLKEFFVKLYSVPESHDVLSQILWIAWARGRKGAEKLLHGLLDKSEKAKACMLRYFQKDTVNDYYKFVKPVVEWCADSEDEEVGKMCDYLIRDLEDLAWEKVVEIIDLYTKGKVIRYASHNFLEFMQESAAMYPYDVLKWMCIFSKSENKDETNYFMASRTMGIMVAAYNAIRKYDKNDGKLEVALDTMDYLMEKENVRKGLKQFLYELDNR